MVPDRLAVREVYRKVLEPYDSHQAARLCTVYSTVQYSLQYSTVQGAVPPPVALGLGWCRQWLHLPSLPPVLLVLILIVTDGLAPSPLLGGI